LATRNSIRVFSENLERDSPAELLVRLEYIAPTAFTGLWDGFIVAQRLADHGEHPSTSTARFNAIKSN
jgi:hypothetical protein